MKVTLDREGQNVVHLGLEVEAEKAIREYEKACRLISQNRNIPGFRRGKAPRAIIEKTFGVDYIKAVALENLVPRYLSDAITDQSIDVITEPQIESCVFELGSPLKFTAKFEVRPEVTLGEYSGVSVQVPEAKLPADAMEKALTSIAESKSSLKAVPNRTVVNGDTVLLDFECFVDGNTVEGGKADGLVLEVKEGTFIEGFCEQLVGKEPGPEFEIKVKFPEEYRNKELANKDATFKVVIREIRERVLPEVNDEMAKSLGQETLEQLKSALTERLEEEVRQENEVRSQRAVVEAIVNNAKVDIPSSMIERERDLLLLQVRRYLEQNNQSWEVFEQSSEFESVRDSKLEEARQRVLTSLVLGAIVRAENVQLTEEELKPYVEELAARYNVPIEQIAGNEDARRQIMEEVLTSKVVELLMTKAKIEYVPEDENAKGKAEHGHDHDHGHSHDHSHGHDHAHDQPADSEAESGEKSKKKSASKTGQKS
jgi:trigger factor